VLYILLLDFNGGFNAGNRHHSYKGAVKRTVHPSNPESRRTTKHLNIPQAKEPQQKQCAPHPKTEQIFEETKIEH
jgi:hypothetical protein